MSHREPYRSGVPNDVLRDGGGCHCHLLLEPGGLVAGVPAVAIQHTTGTLAAVSPQFHHPILQQICNDCLTAMCVLCPNMGLASASRVSLQNSAVAIATEVFFVKCRVSLA